MKKALVTYGGWDGHQPDLVAKHFEKVLKEEGFEVIIEDNLDLLNDLAFLYSLDLIVPVWTMSTIEQEQLKNITTAVASGVGLAGCHGGMCDAFRNSVEWQFMTGGNWVAHPGNDGVEYKVEFKNSSSPLTEGMNDFMVKSEQYYLHVDPAVEVLATTRFPVANGFHVFNKAVDMPVVWTKRWGFGRVYYTSLGHSEAIVKMPEVTDLIRKGFVWAAEGKEKYKDKEINLEVFSKDAPSIYKEEF
ncbi:ThuA domain-containing protein [Clostridium grantii]|uniref:ThuA-like domain-containing protein n=1 Tax=Clostridium grantii DSM 8605 TaxID=1121316 RepID=A0A1M5T3T4_9CLOT|nr:ThuA domain-containing protein [Clostridium grantii]SHH45414.1 hypothetical protein SAMN02745207_01186 [Clostridium grantii DSM 8605]